MIMWLHAEYCALISSERGASWHFSITNPVLISPLIVDQA